MNLGLTTVCFALVTIGLGCASSPQNGTDTGIAADSQDIARSEVEPTDTLVSETNVMDSNDQDIVPLDVPSDTQRTPTDLTGDFACGSSTCSSGQVCVYRYSGVDTGMATVPSCVTPPANCTFYDCGRFSNSCCDPGNECALSLCTSSTMCRGGFDFVGVTGRRVECYGI